MSDKSNQNIIPDPEGPLLMDTPEYTPTTDRARNFYVASPMATEPREEAETEFDRWLASVRAEAREQALNEARTALNAVDFTSGPLTAWADVVAALDALLAGKDSANG